MKKILMLLLCMMMVLAIAAPTALADPLRCLYGLEGDTLNISGLPGESTVSITVNGQNITPERTTAQQTNTPILYFCIVDPSSSFADIQKQHQREVLSSISQNMGTGDAMVLATMDADALHVGQLLTTPEAREAAIGDSWHPSFSTRLFEDVDAAMKALKDPSYADYLPCAVLITDGINDGAKLKDQAAQSIRASGIRFHSVALVCPMPTTYAKNNAAQALSFTESSYDSIATIPLVDKVEPAAVGKQIVDAMRNSMVLQLDTTKLDRQAALQTIGLSAQLSDRKLECTFDLPTAQLPALSVPQAIETQAPETSAPADTLPQATPQTQTPTEITPLPIQPLREDSSKALMIGSAVIIVVVLIVLAFFLFQRKEEERQVYEMLDPKKRQPKAPKEEGTTVRKPKAPEKPKQPEKPRKPENAKQPDQTKQSEEFDLLAWAATLGVLPEDGEGIVSNSDVALGLSELEFDQSSLDLSAAQPAPEALIFSSDLVSSQAIDTPVSVPEAAPVQTAETPIPVPGCHLKLVPTVDLAWTTEYFLPVNEAKSFGRSHRADFQLNETDAGLSGIHFEMLWDGRALFLRDKNSTNGTALNTVPLVPDKWVRIKKNPVILAGSYEYKIIVGK